MSLFKPESSLKGRINQVLPRVAKPARYTGGELHSVRKSPDTVSVRFALAFPDVYEVGMSNLGLRILYHILNGLDHVAAERVFAPARDMEQEMRAENIPLFSLESSLPVREFDLIGFSLAYEMCYTSVLNMLDLAGIPVLAKDRGNDDPIVLAGGHCASNPAPMADFIDAFVIGDGEEAVVDIVRAYESHRGDRLKVLEALAKVDGVYVPSVHAASDKIRSRVVWDLENAAFPDTLIVPFTEAVHDRVTIEVMRGCSRGCRFCQAGMITRPVRERSLAKLCKQAGTLLENTGYEEVALTSLSSADYTHIQQLVHNLIETHEADKVGISLPSLRADAACVELAAEIQRVRKSGLTFAPEAGTQRLRDIINKNVSDEDLLSAVDTAVKSGWRRIKLYFMIGLPNETDDDLIGIGALVSKVVDIGRKHRAPLVLNITISPFVPKPHTPFQWRAMDSFEELDRKIALIRPLLRGKNISLSWHDPKCSQMEAALARGDGRLSAVILESWKRGGNLEQDSFDYQRWIASFDAAGLLVEDFVNKEISKDAPLPWDHIDVGVSREFLAREDAKSDTGESTPDCRFGSCSGCGVSKSAPAECPPAKPEHVDAVQTKSGTLSSVEGCGQNQQAAKVLFKYKKTEDVRWLGHLDILRVFERAVRMSGIDVMYTEGFNPRVKMSIMSALPLGATADNEPVLIHVAKSAEIGDIVSRLNKSLPDGLPITCAEMVPEHLKSPIAKSSEFVVDVLLPDEESGKRIESAIKQILSQTEILTERESAKKRRTVDLRPGMESLSLLNVSGLQAQIVMLLPHLDFTVKPSEIVAALGEYVPGIQLVKVHRTKVLF